MDLSPDEYEKHAEGVVPGKRYYSAAEAGAIEHVTAKTVHNASSAGRLRGVGKGKARVYHLWDVYKWAQTRRQLA